MRIWAWLTTSFLAVFLSATISIGQRATFRAQNVTSATPPTTVTEDGTGYNIVASGTNTVTLSHGISSGVGVVIIAYTSSSGTLSSCTDNGSGGANSWTVETASPTTTSIENQPCSAFIAHSITTVTLTANAPIFIHVFSINHFASSSWADVHAGSDTSFGTSTTATTSAVSAKVIVFSGCIASSGATSLAITSGYTNLYNDSNLSRVETAWWLEKSSGTASATCSVASNKALSLFVQAYKEQ